MCFLRCLAFCNGGLGGVRLDSSRRVGISLLGALLGDRGSSLGLIGMLVCLEGTSLLCGLNSRREVVLWSLS